ncbi:MAG: YfhO family protein [Anaerolineae bacterium]
MSAKKHATSRRFLNLREGQGKEASIVLLLLALCALFFWRILTPQISDRASFPAGDFYEQFYAFARYEAEQILSGHLPLWNPYTYSGHPFLADVQAAIFYPLSLLTILLSAPWGFSLFALELEAVFHFFLASFFTYLFARRLLRSRPAALLTALVFTYGGYLTSYPSQQLAVLEADIWLPLILLLLDLATFQPPTSNLQPPSPIIGAGVALGVSLLAGHPQSSMYVLYLSLAYLAFRAWGRGWHWRMAVAAGGIFLAVGFSLAAVQLVPSAEYMLLSTRAKGGYSEMSGGFPLYDVLQLLLPGSVSVMSPLYIGILPLLLALWAISGTVRLTLPQASNLREGFGEIVFWALVAVAALFLSFGGNSFFYNLFYIFLPGFKLFRSQERAAFLFSFALAILAGYGARALLAPMSKDVKRRFLSFRRAVGYLFLGGAGLVLLFFYAWLEAEWRKESPFGPLLDRSMWLALLMLFGFGLFYLRERRRLRERALAGLMLALVIIDLFTANWKNNLEEIRPEERWKVPPVLAYPLADEGMFRIYNEWRLPGNYGCIYGLEDIWGASPLRLKWYDSFFTALPIERVWELTNVKYVLTWRKVLLPRSEILYQEGEGENLVYIHRLEKVAPRAWLVWRAEVVPEEEKALERLSSPDFDPLKSVVLAEGAGLALKGGGQGRVEILERSPNRLKLEAETASDSILVLSEIYCPGWMAHVDGREEKILRANYALRAIPLKAGRHTIEMAYRPISVVVGGAISALAVLAIIAFMLIRTRPGDA